MDWIFFNWAAVALIALIIKNIILNRSYYYQVRLCSYLPTLISMISLKLTTSTVTENVFNYLLLQKMQYVLAEQVQNVYY